MLKDDDTLTTAQAAKMLGVSVGTVCKQYDLGLLTGWKIPGSNHRRIPLKNLVEFAKKCDIPLQERVDETV